MNIMNKKNKGKAAKKKMSFQQRKAKAKKWVENFDVSQGDIIKMYRKKFAVDRLKAVTELQCLGIQLSQEQIDKEKRIVEFQKKQKLSKKKKRRKQRIQKQQQEIFNDFQNDRFYFIAGYTSGGAPYGVTWEEMGLSPYEECDGEIL